MNFLPGVSAVRILGTIVLVLGLIGTGAWFEHRRMQKKLDKVTAEFNQFKGGVAALGRAAADATRRKIEEDRKAQERANEELNRLRAADEQRIARVRAESDAARRGFVSAVTAATRRAEEAEKLGANFERAYRALVEDLRAIGDEGTDAVRDLDSAKTWASER